MTLIRETLNYRTRAGFPHIYLDLGLEDREFDGKHFVSAVFDTGAGSVLIPASILGIPKAREPYLSSAINTLIIQELWRAVRV